MEKVEETEDCYVIYNFLDESENVIQNLEKEINFKNVCGKPKAVFQSLSSDLNHFYYLRCPSIKPEKITDFTPMIEKINNQLKTYYPNEKCNIAKIVKYGDDSSTQLKNHSDKIIDLKHNSNIFSVRFGATKYMSLIHKQTNKEILVKLPNNSMIVIGWKTNKYFTHGVPKNSEGSKTYSIVLRTSITKLNKINLSLSGKKVGRNNLPYTDEELIKLWSFENKEPISDTHYDKYIDIERWQKI